jgi:Zn-dependent protease with chaperone function
VVVSGFWHPPGASRSEPAILKERNQDMVVVADEYPSRILSRAAVEAVAVSDRLAQIPRRLRFPDNSLFETNDNDGIDALLRRHGRRESLVPRLEEFRPRLLLFVAATLLLIAGIFRFGLPVLADVASDLTPQSVLRVASRGSMATLDQTVFQSSTLPADERRRLETEFAALAAAADPAYTYSLNFRRGGRMEANAFALPDGTVVLTDELVNLAKGDDDMLMAVLGHELGHVARRHGIKQLYRNAGAVALIMMIAGDVGSAAEHILTQGAAVLTLSYSREAENEADRYSVDIMRRVGKDPEALARFFRILYRRGDKSPQAFSTHPGTADRIRAVEAYAREGR